MVLVSVLGSLVLYVLAFRLFVLCFAAFDGWGLVSLRVLVILVMAPR